MDLEKIALMFCGATVAFIWYKRLRAFAIRDVPGPRNPSWIYGHAWSWISSKAIVVEKELLEEYGSIVRWNGLFGEDRLWVADPKAVQHIFQGPDRLYEKPHFQRERIAMLTGWGVGTVEGDAHKRQRRAMAPAFGLVEAKALYPHFSRCFDSLVDKWHETISNSESGQTAIFDVNSWLNKASLDAVGAGAFGYDFGALENAGNKLAETYENLTFDAGASLSKIYLFVMDCFKWAPKGSFLWLIDWGKSPQLTKLRQNKIYAHEVATQLIEEKRQELKDGTSRKDILSLLVKANSALRPDWRLNDDEIIAQVRTLMFAGHETTAKALTGALWELAENRHVQEKLRAEIMETLSRIRARGDSDFTVNDFDSMPYLLAVGKEILRVYPVVVEVVRAPKKDDVLPLSKPFVGRSGKLYRDLHVPAGTIVAVSSVGYNLNKDVWGPDAYEFRPERWLDMNGKPESPVGLYGNLATFCGGHKGCIGWRFAVIELHTFLVTLIRHFDFSLPNDGRELAKTRLGAISPVVVGEEHKGPQLPLKVTILGNA
ncbi:cytochrome P450 [Thelephora terrestris]|uniref:Cytochrome P450 n=1 Tax=Thelephora terrestris TaxID=56493 RepID=A0A9P6L3N3_9AGAM|nr:cytochrome P450 [Thelephora terrestris]